MPKNTCEQVFRDKDLQKCCYTCPHCPPEGSMLAFARRGINQWRCTDCGAIGCRSDSRASSLTVCTKKGDLGCTSNSDNQAQIQLAALILTGVQTFFTSSRATSTATFFNGHNPKYVSGITTTEATYENCSRSETTIGLVTA